MPLPSSDLYSALSLPLRSILLLLALALNANLHPPNLHPSLPSLPSLRATVLPAERALAHPVRDGCVVERAWDDALAGRRPTPWSNEGTYDRRLLELGANITHGYYIETGAWKGEKLSHSWLFESHLCWTGLLVEPSPAYFAAVVNRPASAVYHAGLVASADNGTTLRAGIDDTPTNTAPGGVGNDKAIADINPLSAVVPAYSMETLLKWERVGTHAVDFWTLDVEGLELQVLRGLGPFRPKRVIIEVWDVTKEQVLALMREYGYRREPLALSVKGADPPVQDLFFEWG